MVWVYSAKVMRPRVREAHRQAVVWMLPVRMLPVRKVCLLELRVTLCCAVVSDCPLGADEGSLKPPLPSSGGTEGEVATVSFWQQYVMVQGQMFGAHGSMSDHSYGSRPQQWILLQKTLPYWLDSSTNVSCSGV